MTHFDACADSTGFGHHKTCMKIYMNYLLEFVHWCPKTSRLFQPIPILFVPDFVTHNKLGLTPLLQNHMFVAKAEHDIMPLVYCNKTLLVHIERKLLSPPSPSSLLRPLTSSFFFHLHQGCLFTHANCLGSKSDHKNL